MGIITINQQQYDVDNRKNLLQVCLELGFNIPYFCWHPALNSVGACRLCAVKQFRDEKDISGKIVMSCMTQAVEGIRISTDDPAVLEFRRMVLEWLMTSHPHDCPICDEGGECHLQDMTVMTGHSQRRYRFKKRTSINQEMGPLIHHESNRCIQCYRCVRFYRDYAGGEDFNVFGAHDHIYFGRHEDGVLQSPFSGNLVEICPTGVFTDKTFRNHHTRKWDLQTAPSICVHCSVGCNTTPGERYGIIRRIRNRYHGALNGYFLCDRGRYGYDFVDLPDRWISISHRHDGPGQGRASTPSEAVNLLSEWVAKGKRIAGLGSSRASMETNSVLKALCGEEFYSGIPEMEHHVLRTISDILRSGAVPVASVREIEYSDAILILGEDIGNTAPRLALAARQSSRSSGYRISRALSIPDWQDQSVRLAAQDMRSPVMAILPYSLQNDGLVSHLVIVPPDRIPLLCHAILHFIDENWPEPSDLDPEMLNQMRQIAGLLMKSEAPCIITGSGAQSVSTVTAAAAIVQRLIVGKKNAKFVAVAHQCNSTGLMLLDPKPALPSALNDEWDCLIVAENDLSRYFPRKRLRALFEKSRHVVLLDYLPSSAAPDADLILPAGSFAETSGTLVNYEGRAQRFFSIRVPLEPVRPAYQWLWEAGFRSGAFTQNLVTLDEIDRWMWPLIQGIHHKGPVSAEADSRFMGLKVPRQLSRYSGRTSMKADLCVSEGSPALDPDSCFAFTMEGHLPSVPASLQPSFWMPGWNSDQAMNRFQEEINGSLKGGDPGVCLFHAKESPDPIDAGSIGTEPSQHGGYLFIPIYQVFGSDELSNFSGAVRSLFPEPCLAVNAETAAELHLSNGDTVSCLVQDCSITLPVRLVSGIPPNVFGIPSALTGMILPCSGTVKKEKPS